MTLPKSQVRDPSITPITISIRDAISLSGLSEATIYALIRERKLLANKVGRRHLVSYASRRELLLQPQPEEPRRRGRPRKVQAASGEVAS